MTDKSMSLAPEPYDRSADPFKPYNWDRYEDYFPADSSPAYVDQEQALQEVLGQQYPSKDLSPRSILEVGPGLGRITKILVDQWPSAHFSLADISEAAIEKTSTALPSVDFSYAVGPLQTTNLAAKLGKVKGRSDLEQDGFDLIVAFEVLMHIPPTDLPAALKNLLASLALTPAGVLLTCDWTEPLPEVAPNTPPLIRADNFRHSYPEAFASAGAQVVASRVTGLQTIFTVRRP